MVDSNTGNTGSTGTTTDTAATDPQVAQAPAVPEIPGQDSQANQPQANQGQANQGQANQGQATRAEPAAQAEPAARPDGQPAAETGETSAQAEAPPADPADIIVLTAPPAGELALPADPGVVYRVAAGAPPVSGITQDGGDLLIAFEDGGTIRLQDYLIFLADEAIPSPGLLMPESVLSAEQTQSEALQDGAGEPFDQVAFQQVDVAAILGEGFQDGLAAAAGGAAPAAAAPAAPDPTGGGGGAGFDLFAIGAIGDSLNPLDLLGNLNFLFDSAFEEEILGEFEEDDGPLFGVRALDIPPSIVVTDDPDTPDEEEPDRTPDPERGGTGPVAMRVQDEDAVDGPGPDLDTANLRIAAGTDPLTSITFAPDLSGVTVAGHVGTPLDWAPEGTSGRVIVGTINGVPVIRVTLDGPDSIPGGTAAPFSLVVEQLDNLMHEAPGADPATGTEITVTGMQIVASEADGDSVRADVTVTVEDGVPTVDVFVTGTDGSQTIRPDGSDADVSLLLDETIGADRFSANDDNSVDNAAADDEAGMIGSSSTLVVGAPDGSGGSVSTNPLAAMFGDTIDYGPDDETTSVNRSFGLALTQVADVTTGDPSGTPIDGVETTLQVNGSDDPIHLFRISPTEIGGYVGDGTNAGGEPTGDLAFKILIDNPGDMDNATLTVEQYMAIRHGDTDTLDEEALLNLVNNDGEPGTFSEIRLDLTMTTTVTDADGDTASDTASVALSRTTETKSGDDSTFSAVTFQDDGPQIGGITTDLTDAAVVDETVDGGDDTGDPSVYLGQTSFTLEVDDGTVDYGTDGPGSIAWALVLSSAPANSGLVHTETGLDVYLFTEADGSVAGYATDDPANFDRTGVDPVVTFGIDDSGLVTVTQFEALYHSDPTNHNDDVSLADGVLAAQATVTDADGDAVNDDVDLADLVVFRDDGPAVDVTAVDDDDDTDAVNPDASVSLTLDETVGDERAAAGETATGNLDDPTPAVTSEDPTGVTAFGVVGTTVRDDVAGTANALWGMFDEAVVDYGQDGADATTPISRLFGLALTSRVGDATQDAGGPVATTLSVTSGGNTIWLFEEGGQVVGRVGTDAGAADSGGDIAFRLSVESPDSIDDARLTVEQYMAIQHPDQPAGSDTFDEAALLELVNPNGDADSAIRLDLTLTTTITDGDGDTASDTASVALSRTTGTDGSDTSSVITFEDDGPLPLNLTTHDGTEGSGESVPDARNLSLALDETEGSDRYGDGDLSQDDDGAADDGPWDPDAVVGTSPFGLQATGDVTVGGATTNALSAQFLGMDGVVDAGMDGLDTVSFAFGLSLTGVSGTSTTTFDAVETSLTATATGSSVWLYDDGQGGLVGLSGPGLDADTDPSVALTQPGVVPVLRVYVDGANDLGAASLKVAQFAAIEHGETPFTFDEQAPLSFELAQGGETYETIRLDLTLTSTVTDRDGDQATDTASVSLSRTTTDGTTTTTESSITFDDDGPSVGVTVETDGDGDPASLSLDGLTLDETVGAKAGDTNATDDDATGTTTHGTYFGEQTTATGDGNGNGALTGLFATGSAWWDAGRDGEKSVRHDLGLALRVDDSTVTHLTSALEVSDPAYGDPSITLYDEGGVIVGRVGGAGGPVALTIELNGGTDASGLGDLDAASVTVRQYMALEHGNTGDHDDSVGLDLAAITGSEVSLAVSLTTTVEDNDGDIETGTAYAPLSRTTADGQMDSAITFQDDGPTISVEPGAVLYLADNNSNTIYRVDLDSISGEAVATEAFDLSAFSRDDSDPHIAVSPGGRYVYVVDSGTGELGVYDTHDTGAGMQMVGTLAKPNGSDLTGVPQFAVDANGDLYFGQQGSDKIFKLSVGDDPSLSGSALTTSNLGQIVDLTNGGVVVVSGADIAFGADGAMYVSTRADDGQVYRVESPGSLPLEGTLTTLDARAETTGFALRGDEALASEGVDGTPDVIRDLNTDTAYNLVDSNGNPLNHRYGDLGVAPPRAAGPLLTMDESEDADPNDPNAHLDDPTTPQPYFGIQTTSVAPAGSGQPGALAALFNITADYGTDGAGSIEHTFGLSLTADGAAATAPVATALSVTDVDGVYADDTITLIEEGGIIKGIVGGDSNAVAFDIRVNQGTGLSDATVEVRQYMALEHGNTGNHDDTALLNLLTGGSSSVALLATLETTVTDADGDTATAEASVALASNDGTGSMSSIAFEDDGPTVDVTALGDSNDTDNTVEMAGLSLNLDETVDEAFDAKDGFDVGSPADVAAANDVNNGDLDDTTDGAAVFGRLATAQGVTSDPSQQSALAGLFGVSYDAGQDGEASVSHSFALALTHVSADGATVGTPTVVETALTVTETGDTIWLFQAADGSIEGRVGTDATDAQTGDVAIRLSVNDGADPLNTAQLVVEQMMALAHPENGPTFETSQFDEEALLALVNGGQNGSQVRLDLTLTTTVTDGDGDTDSDTAAVALSRTVQGGDGPESAIAFDDDGPVVADDFAGCVTEGSNMLLTGNLVTAGDNTAIDTDGDGDVDANDSTNRALGADDAGADGGQVFEVRYTAEDGTNLRVNLEARTVHTDDTFDPLNPGASAVDPADYNVTFNTADGTATLDTDLGTLTMDRTGNYVFSPDDDASGGGGETQSLGSEDTTANADAMETAWSGVTLSAFTFTGGLGDGLPASLTGLPTDGTVAYTNRGVGVADNGDGNDTVAPQIDHGPDGDTTQGLVVDLGAQAISASFTVSNLYSSTEGEVGRWTAYDADGNKVGEETFQLSTGNVGTVEIGSSDVSGSFTTLVFTSDEYSGAPATGDSSDYFVRSLDFTTVGAATEEVFYNLKDGDGDVSDWADVTFCVKDDGKPEVVQATALVDEDGIPGIGLNDDASGDDEENDADGENASTLIKVVDFGTDGPAGTDALVFSVAGLDALGLQTASGDDLSWSTDGNGGLVATAMIGGVSTPVMTVTPVVNGDEGFARVTLMQPLQHSEIDTEDNLLINVGYTAKDGDGTAADGTLLVNVDDDLPVVTSVDPTQSLTENDPSVDVDVSTLFEDGADGIVSYTVTNPDTSTTTLTPTGGTTLTFTPTTQGTYTYTVVATDADGDTAEKSFTFTVADDSTPTDADGAGLVDEDGIPGIGLNDDASGDDDENDADGENASTLIKVVDFGTDGPAGTDALVFSAAGLDALGLETASGDDLSWSTDGSGGLVAKAVIGGVETVVMTVAPEISGDEGFARVTLSEPLQHSADDVEDNLLINVGYAATDGDGSELTGKTFEINVDDDLPVVDAPADPTLIVKNWGTEAGYDNSLGFYVLNDAGEPVAGQVIWTNASNDNTGETFTLDLGNPPAFFAANGLTDVQPDQIGFFMLPDGGTLNSGLTDGTVVTFHDRTGGGSFASTDGGSTALEVADAFGVPNSDDVVYFDKPQLNPSDINASLISGTPTQQGEDFIDPDASGVRLYWDDGGGSANGSPDDNDFSDVEITYEWQNRILLDEEGVDANNDTVIDGIPGGLDDLPGEVVEATGTLSVAYGADGPADSDAFVFTTAPALFLPGSTTALETTAIDTDLAADPKTLGGILYTDGTDDVLRITVTQAADGTVGYAVMLSQAVDHPNDSGIEDNLDLDFGFTVKDADGDTATGSLAMMIDDDTPTLTATVDTANDEDAGTDGVQVTAGMIVEGTLDVDFGADGAAATDSLVAVINGETYTSGDPGTLGTLTLTDQGNGQVAWELDTKSDLTEQGVTIEFKATDGDFDTALDTVTFDILGDSVPTAENNTLSVAECQFDGEPTNVMMVLDISGSMDSNDKFEKAVQAIKDLADSYEAAGGVNMIIVPFAADSGVGFRSQPSDVLTSAQAVKDTLDDWINGDNLYPNGTTDYDDAISAAMDAWATNADAMTAPKSVSYFLSDGEPYNSGSETGPFARNAMDEAETVAWETFLTEQGFAKSYALAIEDWSDNVRESLDNIAWKPEDGIGNHNPNNMDGDLTDTGLSDPTLIQVADVDDLPGILTGTVNAISGNMVTDNDPAEGLDDSGYDGWLTDTGGDVPVVAVQAWSTDDAGDGSGYSGTQIVPTTVPAGAVAAFDLFDADSDGGEPVGTITFTADGGYAFRPVTSDWDIASDQTFHFKYTVEDADGDQAAAVLTFTITEGGNCGATTGKALVDEDALVATSLNPGDGSDARGPREATGQLSTTALAGVVFLIDGLDDLGLKLADGTELTWSNDGNAVVAKTIGGVEAIRIAPHSDADDNQYKVTLNEPLDHDPAGPANSDGIENDIIFDVLYTAYDGNGNSVSGSLNVTVDDDAPVALDDANTAMVGTTADGNVLTDAGAAPGDAADLPGADGVGSVVAAGAGVEGSDLYALDGDGSLIIAGQFGVLTLSADGTYSYQVDPTKLVGLAVDGGPSEVSDVFSYQMTDADGDTDTAQLSIDVPVPADLDKAISHVMYVMEDGDVSVVKIEGYDNLEDEQKDPLQPMGYVGAIEALTGGEVQGYVIKTGDGYFTSGGAPYDGEFDGLGLDADPRDWSSGTELTAPGVTWTAPEPLTLTGTAGGDTLVGGDGADTLYGGDGGDTFVVGKGDTIEDFNSGDGDQIDIAAILKAIGAVSDVSAEVGSTEDEVKIQGKDIGDNDVSATFNVAGSGAADAIKEIVNSDDTSENGGGTS